MPLISLETIPGGTGCPASRPAWRFALESHTKHVGKDSPEQVGTFHGTDPAHTQAALVCCCIVCSRRRAPAQKDAVDVAAERCEHLMVLNYQFFKNSYTGASLSYVFYRRNKDICVLKMAPANTSYGKGSFTPYSWQAFLCRDPLRLCESSI